MVKINNPMKIVISVALLSLIFTFNVEAANLTKKERAKVANQIELNDKESVINAFSSPKEKIVLPLIKPVEKKNSVKITGIELISGVTEKAILQLLRSPEHLLKISTGSNISKAIVKIKSGSNTYSLWSKWEKRKLQAFLITVTVYYDNGASPTTSMEKGI